MTGTRPGRGDAGMVAPFVAALTLGAISLFALVLDGGRYIRAQADVFGVAAAAARAGAGQIDQDAILAGEFRLDPVAAVQAAHAYLEARDMVGDVQVDGLEVTVTASRDVDFRLLPGSGAVEEVATARATQERAP